MSRAAVTWYSPQVWMNQTADNHIFKFVKNKFVHDSTDFETKLYLCNEAFTWLDWETYRRMSRSLALPLYAGFSLVMVLSYSLLTLARWRVTVSASTQEKEQEQEARAQVLTRTDSRATMYQSTASTASSAAQQAHSSYLLLEFLPLILLQVTSVP